MCRLSLNLGASTSWNPQGLSRPVMGLLYLFTVFVPKCFKFKMTAVVGPQIMTVCVFKLTLSLPN
jgi:hypothetical protein